LNAAITIDLGQRLDGVVEPVGDTDHVEDLLLGIAGPHRRIQDAHGEELGAASRDHHRLDLVVTTEIVDDALHGQEDVAGEPILVTRAVEGQREDALGAGHPEIRRGWRSLGRRHHW
jgi:hypothetical protein